MRSLDNCDAVVKGAGQRRRQGATARPTAKCVLAVPASPRIMTGSLRLKERPSARCRTRVAGIHGTWENSNSSSVFTLGKWASRILRATVLRSLFYLGLQQCFLLTDMPLLFLYCLLGHLCNLSAQGRQLHPLGILPNRA